MAQQIDAGQTLTGNLIIWDTVTDQQVSGPYYTDISATSSDESIATATPKPDISWQVDFTGVASGAATIHITATANYTNSNGVLVAEVKTADVEIEVPAGANATELRVQF